MLYASIHWFALLFLTYMGVELANNPPKDEKERLRWRRRFILIGLLAFAVSADMTYQQTKDAEDAKRIGRGAKGPEISVVLAYGPTNGMNDQAAVAGNPAPFAVVLMTNRSDLPILDLSIMMWETSPAFEGATKKFNASAIAATNYLPAHYSTAIVLPADYVTNSAHFQFTTTDRAGRLDYDFNFVEMSDRWEHSNTLVDVTSRTLIMTDISKGFNELHFSPSSP